MIQSVAEWLQSTSWAWAISGGIPWIWPLCETLHFIGLAMLLGVIGLLDMRMLGLAKGLPIGPIQKLVPWGILGFLVNLVTGALFFIGSPFQYINNIAFLFKLLFIALAGLNVILFYMTGLYRRVDPVGAGQDVPAAGKIAAVVSLTLWVGVIFWGRMLPFIGNAF